MVHIGNRHRHSAVPNSVIKTKDTCPWGQNLSTGDVTSLTFDIPKSFLVSYLVF